ncbi:MAG: F0F1 ATP synthase subunit delta [Robiginitomaculum sp.]|nr:MAG: F0F1 ATP synthase subunit delta [Robiginitomaculum sp.]
MQGDLRDSTYFGYFYRNTCSFLDLSAELSLSKTAQLWTFCMSNAIAITSEAANRYASALLGLAEETKSLKVIEKDLRSLKAMFTTSADLVEMAASPVISDANKAKAMLALATKAKFSKLTKNFIGTVADNGRSGELPSMIVAFEQMLAERRGTESALVTSAKKLTAAQVKSISANLKKSLGHSVTLETAVDPELLGGFAVKIGSRYYDATLKTKLEGLKLAMKEA